MGWLATISQGKPIRQTPVEQQHVKVQIEVQGRTEALDQGDRAGFCRRSGKTRLAGQMAKAINFGEFTWRIRAVESTCLAPDYTEPTTPH